jgi:hypothetical protein
LQFRVTGYFVPGAQAMALVSDDERVEVPLPVSFVGKDEWVPVTVRAPHGPFVIEASPTQRDLWWGFTAPAEVGPLTGRAEQLLGARKSLAALGAVLWLSVLALAFAASRAARMPLASDRTMKVA